MRTPEALDTAAGGGIRVADVSFRYDASSAAAVIEGLSFDVAAGEFVSVVGPSGCGKTTLLRILAGLEHPGSGSEVRVNGRTVDGPPDGLRVVFQDYGRALLPWRTAAGNVELGLEAQGLDRRSRKQRVEEALERVHLPHAQHLYPHQLSGGMQQRLQIARAIATRPSILLMDEPFASLDALTRFSLEDGILELWRQLAPTIVFVTHDLDEAIYLADRVLVLRRDPANVEAEVPVGLARPRDQADTKADDQFVRLRYELYETIRKLARDEG